MLFASLGTLLAGPEGPPSEALVRKLIAEEAEVVPTKINIAVVLQGRAKRGEGFETDDAARVVFIWNRVEDGRNVRRVEARTFYWNEKYGWFFFATTHPRGGEAVDICSEKEGILRLR